MMQKATLNSEPSLSKLGHFDFRIRTEGSELGHYRVARRQVDQLDTPAAEEMGPAPCPSMSQPKPSPACSPDEFAKFIAENIKWTKVIKFRRHQAGVIPPDIPPTAERTLDPARAWSIQLEI
jgi:hypothetical protein